MAYLLNRNGGSCPIDLIELNGDDLRRDPLEVRQPAAGGLWITIRDMQQTSLALANDGDEAGLRAHMGLPLIRSGVDS